MSLVFMWRLVAAGDWLRIALLASLAGVSGCVMFSSDAWDRPSPMNSPPATPPPEKAPRHETQGGFTVLVEGPGTLTPARVEADIGAFAQRRGFVHQGAVAGGERYLLGNVVLDVIYRPADVHVIASLHSARLSRKLVDNFSHDFIQTYAKQYGEDNPIFENDFGDESDVGAADSNRSRGGRR